MKALTLVQISNDDEMLREVAKLTKENKKYMAELARYYFKCLHKHDKERTTFEVRIVDIIEDEDTGEYEAKLFAAAGLAGYREYWESRVEGYDLVTSVSK